MGPFSEKSKFEQLKAEKYHDLIVAKRRKTIIIIVVIIAAIVAAYFIFAFLFTRYFYPHTVINGVNCSWKNVSTCDELLKQGADGYVLTLYEQDGSTEEITGEEVDLELLPEEQLEEILGEQNGFAWIVHLFRSGDEISIDIPISYNEVKLESAMNGLNCLSEDYVIQPVAPVLTDFVEGVGYSVTDPVYGNVVDRDALLENLNNVVGKMIPTLHLAETGCYEGADFRDEIERLDTVRDMLNNYVTRTMTYEFGDQTEVLTGAQINEWLVIEEDLSDEDVSTDTSADEEETYEEEEESSEESEVRELTVKELAEDTSGSIDLDRVSIHVDKDRLAEFVYGLAYDHNTRYLYHTFTTTGGDTITVVGGNYGWYMDQSATLEKLITYLDAGVDYTGEAEFIQRAAQWGDRDYGTTYVEISLSQQHMWYYRLGVLTLESDIVSGNPTTDHGTEKGCFMIAYKARDQVLEGEDYSSAVSYWMPFYDGVGLHDAPWRSSFGGTIYQYSGSHGCINLPYSVAEELYGYIEGGEAVIIY